jgi:DNA mismatch repair protein MutL
MRIAKLAPGVVARIAAGEVVDRPASAAKELVENAIDAGARRIVLDVEGGGVDLIRVADDGTGIDADDLTLAFERHATSKLGSDDDLTTIRSLGFRGEALPSIAAVADVDCLTRTAAQPHAWQIPVRGGTIGAPEPATRAVGTTMTVRSVFAELPARRKFLRGRSTEAGHVVAVAASLALAYPEIALRVVLDGKTALETPGDGDPCAAVAAVHGSAIAPSMVPIQTDEESATGIEIGGCLSDGRATLPTRAGFTLLINRRPIQHRALTFAVEEAYRTLVPVGRHPIVALDIRVPPEQVDINVHPRKSEVRLLDERQVFGAVQRAIRQTLATATPVRSADRLDAADIDLDEAVSHWGSGLRVLGQAGGTYIIAEGRSGLYLVDQHAAHERVLYESLLATCAGAAAMQPLLAPEVLEIGARELSVLRDHFDAARALGYDAEPFGETAVLVRGVPAPLVARDPLGTFRSAMASFTDERPPQDWRDRLAILFACHNAVRAGDRLTEQEMEALLDQLGEAELCHACSHGRPTAILLSHSQLAREFGRPV